MYYAKFKCQSMKHLYREYICRNGSVLIISKIAPIMRKWGTCRPQTPKDYACLLGFFTSYVYT